MTNKKPLDAHDREVRRLALEEAASVCRAGVASGGPGHSWRLDCAEEIEALIDDEDPAEQTVTWIVDLNGELGVRVGGSAFFFYKWPDSTRDADAYDVTTCPKESWPAEGRAYRTINKREFGETIRAEMFSTFDFGRVKPAMADLVISGGVPSTPDDHAYRIEVPVKMVTLYCTGCGATRAEKATGTLAASHGFDKTLICDPPPPCACGRGRWRYVR